MTEANAVFIDTNILVYAFENSADSRCATCADLVKSTFQGKQRAVVSNQVMAEFFHVATRKSTTPLSKDEAKKFIWLIDESSHWPKLNYNAKTVIKAIELSKQCTLSLWDALIAATMIENNLYTIYTENEKDFSKIPGIKVVNPMRRG